MNKILDKDKLEIDIKQNKITNLTRKESYSMKAFPELIAKIVEVGGLMNYNINDKEGTASRNF
jgi:3-isopropylmalate/(R)-2-methylmalate dehydratase small subunit